MAHGPWPMALGPWPRAGAAQGRAAGQSGAEGGAEGGADPNNLCNGSRCNGLRCDGWRCKIPFLLVSQKQLFKLWFQKKSAKTVRRVIIFLFLHGAYQF